MICYLDTTFCISPGCKCERALTPEIREAAERWWERFGDAEWRKKYGGPPIAMAYFHGGEPEVQPSSHH